MVGQGKSDSIKSVVAGILKSRLDNIGDAAKQSLNDVGNNVTSSIRTGFGLLSDENTSFLQIDADPSVPIYEVMASNEGKNAKVSLWPDRLEWEKGRGISAGKVLLGITGISLAFTGLRGQKDAFESIPLAAITNVSLIKDGLGHQKVSVSTAGGVIEFRISRQNAAEFRLSILKELQVLNSNPRVSHAVPEDSASQLHTTSIDPIEQLERIAVLRDKGILSEEEFQQKKAQIMERF